MLYFKKSIHKLLNFLGLRVNLIRNDPVSPLLFHKIDTLLDVGANIGQFAQESRKSGYSGRILSFEPLPEAHRILLAKSSVDPLWDVHDRCAIGSNHGDAIINISKNSFSSSLLAMNDRHSSAAPESVYIGSTQVKVLPLDHIFELYNFDDCKIYLKIDTQGFEKSVLDGVQKNLSKIFAIQLELSVVSLYKDQLLYEHYLNYLAGNGFELWSLVPGFHDPVTGQLLQFDAVFVRCN